MARWHQRQETAWIGVALAGAAWLAGCAGPVTQVPQASLQSWRAAQAEYRDFQGARERTVAPGAEVAAVDRVWKRVWPAARAVCRRLLDPRRCDASFATMQGRVFADDRRVNAWAAADGAMGFLGGLVRATGNDDELAAVMAHEMAHVLYEHNQKTSQNTTLGMLVGAGVGLAVGAALHTPGQDPGVIGDMMDAGSQAGRDVGYVVYSPQMELEADHFAAFVLGEAGYDPRKGGRVFIRMAKMRSGDIAAGRRSFVSYFNTHPADDVRAAQWQESVASVRQGRRNPTTIEEAQRQAKAVRARWRDDPALRFQSARCQAAYRSYPKCGWWTVPHDASLWRSLTAPWTRENMGADVCPIATAVGLAGPKDFDLIPDCQGGLADD